MTLSFDSWVRDEVEERDLDGYAREAVEEALLGDSTLSTLWQAQYAADDRQSRLRDPSHDDPVVEALVEARRATDEALDQLADEVVDDAVRTEVGGHSVDLRHARRLDCPACEEQQVEAYYLGHADDVVGWVCGHCEAVVEEWPDVVVESTEPEGPA